MQNSTILKQLLVSLDYQLQTTKTQTLFSTGALRILYKNYLFVSEGRNPPLLNPLSPNGDQHQFSSNDIHTLLRDQVIRINKLKMIIKEKMP